MFGVPLRMEGHVIGVMPSARYGAAIQGSDVDLLQLAADRAALAIDIARISEQRSATSIMPAELLPTRCRRSWDPLQRQVPAGGVGREDRR